MNMPALYSTVLQALLTAWFGKRTDSIPDTQFLLLTCLSLLTQGTLGAETNKLVFADQTVSL